MAKYANAVKPYVVDSYQEAVEAIGQIRAKMRYSYRRNAKNINKDAKTFINNGIKFVILDVPFHSGRIGWGGYAGAIFYFPNEEEWLKAFLLRYPPEEREDAARANCWVRRLRSLMAEHGIIEGLEALYKKSVKVTCENPKERRKSND